MPLLGTPEKDFFIDEYVDNDPSDNIHDAFCGNKTYNGHKGTDFILRSFKTMDSGIYVYAVADGIVLSTDDGLYDRNKKWVSGGLGNHILIVHAGRYRTLYGHLMKNSLLVHTGDSVKAGQPLAKVGSSGYSKGPHLHLEIHDMQTMYQVVDPFQGPCQSNMSLWLSQPAYDTARYRIDDGFAPYIPNLDSLKERWLVNDTLYANKDTVVCYWILMHGLRKHDAVRTEWYDPEGRKKFQYLDRIQDDDWFSYRWCYLHIPDEMGVYNVQYYVNDKLMASRNCYIKRRKKSR